MKKSNVGNIMTLKASQMFGMCGCERSKNSKTGANEKHRINLRQALTQTIADDSVRKKIDYRKDHHHLQPGSYHHQMTI